MPVFTRCLGNDTAPNECPCVFGLLPPSIARRCHFPQTQCQYRHVLPRAVPELCQGCLRFLGSRMLGSGWLGGVRAGDQIRATLSIHYFALRASVPIPQSFEALAAGWLYPDAQPRGTRHSRFSPHHPTVILRQRGAKRALYGLFENQ